MTYISENDITLFLERKRKFFNKADILRIQCSLSLCDITLDELDVLPLKSPAIGLFLSVVSGFLGIDRFYAGNHIAGVIKLLSTGLCGIWWVIDWFLIKKAIRTKNYNDLDNYLTEIMLADNN